MQSENAINTHVGEFSGGIPSIITAKPQLNINVSMLQIHHGTISIQVVNSMACLLVVDDHQSSLTSSGFVLSGFSGPRHLVNVLAMLSEGQIVTVDCVVVAPVR